MAVLWVTMRSLHHCIFHLIDDRALPSCRIVSAQGPNILQQGLQLEAFCHASADALLPVDYFEQLAIQFDIKAKEHSHEGRSAVVLPEVGTSVPWPEWPERYTSIIKFELFEIEYHRNAKDAS